MLAEHPKIADRLRAEIFAKVGATSRPTYDDMREMKYLRAFINGSKRVSSGIPRAYFFFWIEWIEVLRLYPAVWVIIFASS